MYLSLLGCVMTQGSITGEWRALETHTGLTSDPDKSVTGDTDSSVITIMVSDLIRRVTAIVARTLLCMYFDHIVICGDPEWTPGTLLYTLFLRLYFRMLHKAKFQPQTWMIFDSTLVQKTFHSTEQRDFRTIYVPAPFYSVALFA